VELAMASVDGEVVSATRIREHLAHGDVGRAGDLLGRPYDVVGCLSGATRPCLIRISRCGRYPRPVATGPRSGRSARGIAGRRRRSSWSIRAANVSTTWRWSCRRTACRTERPGTASA
jgi:hypothetical protein